MPQKSSNLQIWRRHSNRKVIICIVGFCLAVFGVLCGMFCNDVFSLIVAKEMTLRPNSRAFNTWKNPPMKLSIDIYFFNWTNAEEFRISGATPRLEQLGPYRFTDNQDKVDIVWNDHNSTVTYRRKSDFYFDAEGSRGSLDDEIAMLNPVALSAAAKTKSWGAVRRGMVDVALKVYNQDMFVLRSADELLFTGYQDDMIDMARTMPFLNEGAEVPFDRFGWFYTRNGSADLTGVFNVFTGADDRAKLGQMHSWNYQTHTGFFESQCGLINGSAGEFQPPNLRVNDTVALFTPDMCRTVPLDFVEQVEIEGVLGYKYAGGERSIDNGTVYPDNACFCAGECVPSGVMNISSCRFGSPVFMSYPHFYGADPYYTRQVHGLVPNREAHEFYMVMAPSTGIPLEVAARFQVNMMVEPIAGITLYENISRTFMPLIWFEQKVRITPELAEDLKLLPLLLMGGQIFAGVCFVGGLLLLCWYPAEEVWRRYRANETQLRTELPENGKCNMSLDDCQKTTASPVNADASPSRKTSPDVSPLLDKSQHRLPQVQPLKLQRTVSVGTNTENFSVAGSFDEASPTDKK